VSERLFKGAMRTAVIFRQTIARLLRLRNENFTTKGAKNARRATKPCCWRSTVNNNKKPHLASAQRGFNFMLFYPKQ